MYSLHPGYEINPKKTPELANACKETLKVRGDEGTGWSIAWKSNFWARLREGNHVLKLIKLQLKPSDSFGPFYYHSRRGGTYPNLFCACPPFQIDGNFGVTSAISEMLIYSELDNITILPAIPDEWNNIEFSGICAKGNRKISLKYSKGDLEYIKIYGSLTNEIYYKGQNIADKFTKEKTYYIYKK